MEQSKGFRLSSKKKKVWKLHKVLYILKQASLFWWWTITKSILTLEFKWCKFNTDMYNFINKETRELVIVIVYINDICFMSSKESPLLLELKWKFMIEWECYDLRETKEFLGMYISYNCKDQKIFINQSKYLNHASM